MADARRILFVVLAVAAIGYRGWLMFLKSRPDHTRLTIVPPDGWKVQPDSTKNPEAYMIIAKDGMEAMCGLQRWKVHSNPADFPKIVGGMASTLVQEQQVKNQIASERYEVLPFAGAHCQGSFAVVLLKGLAWSGKTLERREVFFLLSADGSLWNGDFSGTPENWAKALEMLKGIQKEK